MIYMYNTTVRWNAWLKKKTHAIFAGITFPNAESQANMIKTLYKRAGVDVNDLAYMEAHSTGTKVRVAPVSLHSWKVFNYNRAVVNVNDLAYMEAHSLSTEVRVTSVSLYSW